MSLLRLCDGCRRNGERKMIRVTNGALVLCNQCLGDLDRKAVAAEREACAKIAHDIGCTNYEGGYLMAEEIERQIRARSNA